MLIGFLSSLHTFLLHKIFKSLIIFFHLCTAPFKQIYIKKGRRVFLLKKQYPLVHTCTSACKHRIKCICHLSAANMLFVVVLHPISDMLNLGSRVLDRQILLHGIGLRQSAFITNWAHALIKNWLLHVNSRVIHSRIEQLTKQ